MLNKIFQFLMLLSLIIQSSAAEIQSSAGNLQSDHILIKFSNTNPDNLALSPMGARADASWIFPVKEEIKKFPENHETIHTFHLPIQPDQCAYNCGLKDKEVYKLILEDNTEYYNTGMTYSQYLKSRYTTEPVDCIISICVIKEGENEFIVIDVNNDEDFTNDPVLSYSTMPAKTTSEKITIPKQNYVDVHTIVEYCDANKKVLSKEIPIRFSKISSDKYSYYCYSIQSVKYGKLSVDDEEYLAILSDSALDFDVESILSIDSNKNHKFDDKDFSTPLFQPFTFKGISYDLYELDPMGNYIILKKANVPVVQVGFQAPEFESITIDSRRFKLSDYKGKYVLIDFWATWCGPCVLETPYLKNAYKQFKEKGFEIVAVAIQDNPDKIKAYVRDNELDWMQICQKGNEIMKLYQVNSIPEAFLINTEGVIVNRGNELRGENLQSTLEKYFKDDHCSIPLKDG